jgi:hypothetical protein
MVTRVWCRTCARVHYRLTPHAGPLEPIGMDWQRLAADCFLGVLALTGFLFGMLWFLTLVRP